MSEGYKVTELGDIPESWEVKKLLDFANVVTGTTPPTINKESYDGTFPWVTPTDINDNKYISHTSRRLSVEGLKKGRFIPANSVLITCIASIGKNAILTVDGSCNQQINAVLPSENHNSDFLYYSFENDKERLKRISASTAVPIINKATFERFAIVFPPLPEQQKIASILSTVDEKIAIIDAQISQTQELKKGLMQQLLSKGIGHTKFKSSELGDIPESWEVVRLEEISDFITKGATPTTYGFEWVENGILFLRSECVGPSGLNLSAAMNISAEANTVMSRSEIKPGDILMTITGNVGRVCVLPNHITKANINQHIARIRITDKRTESSFIYQYLSQAGQISNYYRITTGQAYPQLSLKQVRDTLISVPPIVEQKKIGLLLNTIDEKLNSLQSRKEIHQQLKKGLMQQLLTGKIRVNTSQNEPALA